MLSPTPCSFGEIMKRKEKGESRNEEKREKGKGEKESRNEEKRRKREERRRKG